MSLAFLGRALFSDLCNEWLSHFKPTLFLYYTRRVISQKMESQKNKVT